ncbi:MAG: transcriptional regulator [Myxococcales bacterium]|jgi:DNA-binding HxlR family transcriptional regulator|nr:MAG: transcriptional regulator [Myxococcales bacterium]
MKRSSIGHLNCSVARALEVVGEWWTPMIIREVFFGRRRFSEMQRDLGIAKNILSDRLVTLVRHGVLERHIDTTNARHPEYRLTEKGASLFPLVVALMQWGDQWQSDGTGAPIELIDVTTDAPVEPMLVDRRTGREIDYRGIELRRGPGWTQVATEDARVFARPAEQHDQRLA